MEKQDQVSNPRKSILKIAIANILAEHDFVKADKQCFESLAEMLQSLIVEISNTARSYAELSGRTQPVIGDVVVALINLGISLQGITSYAKRENMPTIPSPQQAAGQKQLCLLQAGTKLSHPPHISNYLPDLPDPHAYIRTPTHKQPVTEYEAIREKAANQKRDIEKALTKFLAKTSETHCLFSSEDNHFPLIACKPMFPPYLAALNPTDQVFDFEELEYHYLVANRTEDVSTSKDDEEEDDEEGNGNDSKNDGDPDEKEKMDVEESSPVDNTINSSPQMKSPNIDNPYLKAAKAPKQIKSEVVTSLNFG